MSFFMTSFYFFSGFLFSSKRSASDFVYNKVRKLLFPYVFWSVISLVVYYANRYILYGTIDFSAPFYSLVSTGALASNTPLWFFFSLFSVSIIYYFIDVYVQGYYKHILILGSFLFAFLVHNRMQILSDGNIALGLVYYHLGYFFKRLLTEKKDFPDIKILVLTIVIFVLILFFNRQDLSFVLLYQRTGSFLLNLPYSLCACYILWYIGCKIGSAKYLVLIGEYSLTLFASHRIILNWIYDPIVRYLNPQFLITYYEYMLVGGSVILVFYLILVLLLKKIFPQVIGL